MSSVPKADSFQGRQNMARQGGWVDAIQSKMFEKLAAWVTREGALEVPATVRYEGTINELGAIEIMVVPQDAGKKSVISHALSKAEIDFNPPSDPADGTCVFEVPYTSENLQKLTALLSQGVDFPER